MIPKHNPILQKDFVFQELPTNTFQLNSKENTICGFVDGLAAMRQAVYLMLNVERYEYLIYSWNYGIELRDLLGQSIPFVLSVLEERISDALLQDKRIEGVEDFSFKVEKNKVYCNFQVHTVLGKFEVEKVVEV